MFNVFVSLEDVLAPIGEPKAPVVGLQIEDWDENVEGILGQVVDLGYAVQILDRSTYSGEALNPLTGIQEPDDRVSSDTPQVIFYYKGRSEADVLDGIPVLLASEGKVQVSHEGRVKELADFLGVLDHEDRQDEVRP